MKIEDIKRLVYGGRLNLDQGILADDEFAKIKDQTIKDLRSLPKSVTKQLTQRVQQWLDQVLGGV